MSTIGCGFTNTVTLSVPLQVPETFTIYVVVTNGLATGEGLPGLSKLEVGVQR